jgi:4-amino-4-deoxy-L-arabinose transferase-like glycosyltransferase
MPPPSAPFVPGCVTGKPIRQPVITARQLQGRVAALGGSSRLALWAICTFVVVLGFANVARYPPGLGYDGADHMAYADGLVPGGQLPHNTGEYYTPPGYYAVAGSADWIAKELGVGEPHRAGMALNVLFLLGTVLLVWKLARELWPTRDRLALAACAFVAFVPITSKTEAMFHPEMLSLFLSTLALWLCLRTFANSRYAVALGVALGAAQLVRAFALWTVAAVVIALLLGRRWRELAIVVVVAGLIPAPWYIHQQLTYHGSPVFNRPTTQKPLYERRPVRFYVDPGLPDVVTKPYRGHFVNLALPTTYSELWGDYFGHWAWRGVGKPPARVRHELELQSVIGILPTLLALVGLAGLLSSSLRSPPRLAIALLPLIGILGYLYFTVSYPTSDGNVLKANYMLTTMPGWALGFAYALERLGRARLIAIALLSLSALAELPFLIFR